MANKVKDKLDANPIHSDYLPVIPDIRLVPQFLEFVRWYGTPSWLKEVKTQKEFAELIGVSQDTLTDWKNHKEFWNLVGRFIREWMQEQIPDVIAGFSDKIISGKGSSKDLELFIRLTEDESKISTNK